MSDRGAYGRRDVLGTMPDDWLPVLCWCQYRMVPVPQAEVMRVLTRSCGRPQCDEYDRQHRKESA